MSITISQDELKINICFPIPLPELELNTDVEETGFTGPEKVSLRNAFRILKQQSKHHARQIYLNFYTENEIILERYRCGIDKFHLKNLNQHTLWLFESFTRLVDEALDNPILFHIILTETANRHKKQHFTEEDVTLLAQNVRSYILDVLKNVSSPTFVNAVTKLCQLLVVYHFGEDLNYLRKVESSVSISKTSTNSESSKIRGTRNVDFSDHKKELRQSVQSVSRQPEK